MTFDLPAIFANLAEKEKLKGHHSPEGQAIRTLSRALSGWTAGNLAASDVLVLSHQAMEEWLKARLKATPWSTRSFPELLEKAVDKKLVERLDAVRLEKLHLLRTRLDADEDQVNTPDVEAALELCIRIVEEHW